MIRLENTFGFWPLLHVKLFGIIDILGIPASLIQTTGFLWDLHFCDWDDHCRTWLLFLLYYLLYYFVYYTMYAWESFSYSPNYVSANLSFLAEVSTFSAKISWYFSEFIAPLILNNAPGLPAAKHPKKINYTPYFTLVKRCFSLYTFYFGKHVDGVYDPKT